VEANGEDDVKQAPSLMRVSIEVRIGPDPITLIPTLNVPNHLNPRRTKPLIPSNSQLLAHLTQSIIIIGSQMKSGLNDNARIFTTSVGRSGTHPIRVNTAINTWC